MIDTTKAYQQLDRTIVSKTPCEYDTILSERYNAQIFLKREDLQPVRSFKIRWAYNKIQGLSESEKKAGVVAASAGNHAQGVAVSCAKMKIYGTIFMPQTTPSQKVRKTKKFWWEFITIVLTGDTFNDAYQASLIFAKDNKSTFIHPFDDEEVIAGQWTMVHEIIADLPEIEIDYILVAIGGGGLISWILQAQKLLLPNTTIIGVESEWSACMKKSLEAGAIHTLDRVDTFADGVAVKTPGIHTFEICKQSLQEVITIPDGQTATVMLSLIDEQGIITEPAGALSIAALDHIQDKIKGKNVVCIVCGWNFDLSRLPNVQEKSLRYLWLKKYFIINFPQRPGALKEFIEMLGPDDDIVRFEYMKKTSKESGPALIWLETKAKTNFDIFLTKLTISWMLYEDITNHDMYFDLLV